MQNQNQNQNQNQTRNQRNLSAIEKWQLVKTEWNTAFLSACATAEAVSKQVKDACGQDIDPGALLQKLQYRCERVHEYSSYETGPWFADGKYIATCWYWWGKPQPIGHHWFGSLSEVRESVLALKNATPEKLHCLAAEMLDS